MVLSPYSLKFNRIDKDCYNHSVIFMGWIVLDSGARRRMTSPGGSQWGDIMKLVGIQKYSDLKILKHINMHKYWPHCLSKRAFQAILNCVHAILQVKLNERKTKLVQAETKLAEAEANLRGQC